MVNRNKSRKGGETNLRHVWLASLGVVSVGRREARKIAADVLDRTGRLGQQAASLAIDVRDVARGGAMTVREGLQARMQKASATRRKPVRRKARG